MATVNAKVLSLMVLVVQNTFLVLLLRYSRTVEGPMYLASTAVVCTELVKFAICFGVLFHRNSYDVEKTAAQLKTEIFYKFHETAKLSVPSVLYTIQNNLLYVALSNLNAATFQVTYQLKILTTALFSVLILHKTLDGIKWLSLVVLMLAVALVQLPANAFSGSPGNASELEEVESPLISPGLVGLTAILLACCSSGFSGVYIEMLLKQSDTSIWIRNIQMSLMSFFIGLFGVLVTDWGRVLDGGFFQGYSLVVALVITLQALGGLVVAAVVKYADNILKGFATSVSIVLSSLVSYFILNDFVPSWTFGIGATMVLAATFMYSKPHNTLKLPIQTPKGL